MLEKDIHILVCNYLRTKHPYVMFRSDFASGMKMSIGMARRNAALQSSRAFPDLFIIEPRGVYNGLFIELKSKDNVVFKTDGELRKNKHHEEQNNMLNQLRERGYCAEFGLGYADAITKIDNYLASS